MSFSKGQQPEYRQLVAKAWLSHCSTNAMRPRVWKRNDAECVAWYEGELVQCIGAKTTTACNTGSDYETVMAHFETIPGESFKWQMRKAKGNATRIIHNIRTICAEFDVDEHYMAGIARQALHIDYLPDLSELGPEHLLVILRALKIQVRRMERRGEKPTVPVPSENQPF